MRKILFVDDEPQVLDGLRALLRPRSGQWDMVFVRSGEVALVELHRAPFDVIVSDMKMPGMGGGALLRRVQELFPNVVRIVLSGHAEMETALRTVPVAHQFLMKPCDAGVLENVIDRACSLQALVQDEAVRDIAVRIQNLPSLPRLYLNLTQALANENTGVADTARVAREDPAMCVKILELANSPFLGLSREIESIEQAVAYLGTNMLRNLVLTVGVFRARKESPAQSLLLHRLRRHSLLVGAIARRMAEEEDKRVAEDAFIAGILHDVGKFVLAFEWPEKFALYKSRSLTGSRPMYEVERESAGVTHAEMGGYLLGLWGLPYPVVEAVANGHAPSRVHQRPGVDALTAVYVANALAHEQAAANGVKDDPFAPLDEDYLQALGNHDRLPKWRAIAASQLGSSRAAYWESDTDSKAA